MRTWERCRTPSCFHSALRRPLSLCQEKFHQTLFHLHQKFHQMLFHLHHCLHRAGSLWIHGLQCFCMLSIYFQCFRMQALFLPLCENIFPENTELQIYLCTTTGEQNITDFLEKSTKVRLHKVEDENGKVPTILKECLNRWSSLARQHLFCLTWLWQTLKYVWMSVVQKLQKVYLYLWH